MPWTEDEFRRALEAAAERARPTADALAMIRARGRRRARTRAVGFSFAGAAAVAALIVGGFALRSSPPQDVELAGPGPAGSSARTELRGIRESAGGGSILASISANGRFVVFMSEASNLVAGDTNRVADTFVRDLSTGSVERISVSSSGEQGNRASVSASISADGRFVAFRSYASNLVPGDTNGVSDIFLRDRANGTTTRVSVAQAGSEANGESESASISADGRFVAFRSAASNLVPGDTNGVRDIFVSEIRTGHIERVSVSSSGAQSNGDSRNPHISADGGRVVFSSVASNLVTGDTNRTSDVFVRDRATPTTMRASVSSDGREGNRASMFPAISGDGRVVAFVSDATTLVPGDTNGVRDIFVRDLTAGTTVRASVAPGGAQANGPSFSVAISQDGRDIAFSSDASNLVPGDTNEHRDVFVRDVSTGSVSLASISSAGDRGIADSGGPSISADGRFVTFQSLAGNLGAGDTNRKVDVFLRDTANRTTTRLSAGM